METRPSCSPDSFPQTVQEITKDFMGRRKGLILALTQEFDKMFTLCSQDNHDLCLYGNSDQTWDISPPPRMVPSDSPVPCVGINISRDRKVKEQWILLVAAYAESWLISLAFFYGAVAGISKEDRNLLFKRVNALPAVSEVVRDSLPDASKSTDISIPRTVQQIYNNYRGRYMGVVFALTRDSDKFFKECDPGKEGLCLYGYPNGTWKVSLPSNRDPPKIPQPTLGINFARDEMVLEDWMFLTAAHCDAWLISIAFYYGAKARFNVFERSRLFKLINDLPTVSRVVKLQKDHSSEASGSIPRSGLKINGKNKSIVQERSEEGDVDKGKLIKCDECQDLYCLTPVEITAAISKSISKYECPSCALNKLD